MKRRRDMRKKETISKILKLRHNKKKEIEIKVKKAYSRFDEENYKLQSLQNDYNEKLRSFKKAHEQGQCTAKDMVLQHEFLSEIDGMIKAQKKVYAICEGELEVLKKTLVEAHKDKKVLEILDERVTKQEQKQRLVAEQKEIDFMTITRKIK
jgi:flagellar export protein FliJ